MEDKNQSAPSWLATIAKVAVASVLAVGGAAALGAGWRKLFQRKEFIAEFKEITKDSGVVVAATAATLVGIIPGDMADRRHAAALQTERATAVAGSLSR